MTRVPLDSNILIYAEIEPDSEKGIRSADLILRVARDGVLPVQVLGEFLRFVQRRFPNALDEAIRQARLYQSVFITPPTTEAIINRASGLARAHHLQFWDCVVCASSAGAGATALLTEDMQDGRTLDGLRLINPFDAANTKSIDDLLVG
ncbi:putative nucleic acid-binding protein [Roseiarcus fermentans]|uniref:Putative nucleic acid-binding protein n=1 Tax=Roseiarcus fermentans TaxID=1473586 RepID=A0A366FU46_9HYPH|nr:PIN domain-containing protein [Roseiarcus fermentans]RBP18203.1 putative nucleic acid-binding protein [Roseiarcus fermentans]